MGCGTTSTSQEVQPGTRMHGPPPPAQRRLRVPALFQMLLRAGAAAVRTKLFCLHNGLPDSRTHARARSPRTSPSRGSAPAHARARSTASGACVRCPAPHAGYTILDVIHNPMWEWLTSLLPMWLAPNLITLMGLIGLMLSYLATALCLPDFVGECAIECVTSSRGLLVPVAPPHTGAGALGAAAGAVAWRNLG